MCFRLNSLTYNFNNKPTRAVALTWALACTPLALWADTASDTVLHLVIERPTAAQISTLRETIRELEGGGNTWRPEIADSIISLAARVQESGDHEEAIALLDRAVHISRVNHGLYSLQQVAALKMQVDSHLALDQWQEADDLQQYIFFVHSRSLSDYDASFIPVLEAYAQWNLRAFWQRLGKYPPGRLIDAYHLYSVALSIIDRDPALAEQSREGMLEQMAYLAWLMSRTAAQARPEALYPDIRLVQDAWVDQLTDRRYRQHNNPFLQGEYALQEIMQMRHDRLQKALRSDADAAEQDRLLIAYTNARLDLADWYLLFGRRHAASEAYTQAWAVMANEEEAMRARVFDRVVVLPRYESARQPEYQRLPVPDPVASDQRTEAGDSVKTAPAQTVPYVVMEFDIDQYGRAMNVDIIESWPEKDITMHRRLLRALRASRMRPVIRDGSAVRVEDLVYRFPYEIESRASEAQ